jgi:hypothetical protein
MRRALVTLALAAAAVLPSAPAHADNGAAADPLACAAADSYSRIIDNVPYTFWLVAQEPRKDGTAHRYWQVERHTVEFGPVYDSSYSVECAAGDIVWEMALDLDRWKWFLCEYDNHYDWDGAVPRYYIFEGRRDAYLERSATVYEARRFMYWRVDEFIGGTWVHVEDRVAECDP